MSDPAPSEFFTGDHHSCDNLWAEVETAVEKGDSAVARQKWEEFEKRMSRHFAMEEEVLFPEIETAAGLPPHAGPTAVMRAEHTQMRGVLEQMATEVAKGDFEALVDHGDTLLMLIQQHNVKEEGILYPIADRALGAVWPELTEKLKSYE